ncbi:hypothetical protein BS47DRAFT_871762 [Hydnum rufescens UP504]|uniref:Elongin-A n=1 Tax=Hydnum rufescens UP504 TaxID=1448309 RepID=A0A9P6DTM4_9AGAM|nr:hypothetical protein BS47DRAFT_871762 [Hydnum rufescens UP504]
MPVRSLSELALRSILLHLDGLNSLGTIPYRLAKPILMQCQPEQLMEIERNSPHLKVDDQEIWEELCVKRFDIQRDKEGYPTPKSWRKYYHVALAREKQLEEEAGLRIRSKYQALEAQKQERRLVFTAANVPPMKRARTNGWGKNPAPKTLYEKARSETMRKAGLFAAAKPFPPGPSRTATSPPAGTNIIPTLRRPPAGTSQINLTKPMHIPRAPSEKSIFSPSSPTSPISIKLSETKQAGSPPRPIPHVPPANALFIPKHKSLSQLPSRVRS